MIAAAQPANLLPITRAQYLGHYAGEAWVTPRVIANADALLLPVNAGLLLARQDGVHLRVNPVTLCLVGGTGNGGIRPDVVLDRNGRPIGAGKSWHKRHANEQGLEEGPAAVDVFDPARELCAWSLHNQARLEAIGIVAMEDPRWTPSWCHWQTVRVPSGHFCYIPSADPPLAAAVAGQIVG